MPVDMEDGRLMPHARELAVQLHGRLVALEPLSTTHEVELRAAADDTRLFQWLPLDLSVPEQLDVWMRESLAAAQAGREVTFVIRERASGRIVGSTRFHEIRLEHLRLEIGWTWLTKSAWGTGINVEAKLLLLTYLFERLGLRRVEFKADRRNERSCGALEALGASFEGTFRKHMVTRDGGIRDSAYYAIVDDDWLQVKRRLEHRLERHR